MAAAEQRTMQIVARVKDLASRAVKRMGSAFRVAWKAIQLTRRALNRFGKALFSMKTAVLGAVAVLTTLAGARALGGVIDRVDQLGKLAPTVNDSVENISRLAFAFEDAGFQGRFLQTMMTALARSSSQALNGNQRMVDTFEALGITLDDLKRLGATDLFRLMATNLEQYGTTAEKSAALQQIFADNFRKLLIVIGNGRQAFEEALRAGEEFGAYFGGEDASTAARFTNTMLKLQTAVESISRTFVTEFGPTILPMLEELARALAKNRELISQLVAVAIRGFTELARFLGKLAIGMVKIAEEMPLIFGRIDPIITNASEKGMAKIQALRDEIERLQEQLSSKETDVAARHTFMDLRELDAANGQIALLRRQIAELQQELTKKEILAGAMPLSVFLARTLRELDEVAKRARIASAEAKKVAKAVPEKLVLGPGIAGATGGPGVPAAAAILAGQRVEKTAQEAQGAWDEFFSGFQDKLKTSTRGWDSWQQAGERAAEFVARSLDRTGDALADIITGAKESKAAWKDLARAILSDLARLAVQYVITGSIRRANQFAKGGVFHGGAVSETVPIRQYAKGGIAKGPQVAIFGEAGEEAFVPLEGGSIPVSISGGGQTVNFYVSTIGPRDFEAWLAESRDTIYALVTRGIQGENRALHSAARGKA